MAIKLIDKDIETWSIYNALMLTIAVPISLVYQQLQLLLVLFGLSLISLIYVNRKDLFGSKPIFGIANSITLIRFFIIFCSFFYIDFKNDTRLLFYTLSIAVVLDFFDGKAARYFKESSFFGQYFDMEIDAFYVLLMCCYYYLFFDIPFWILIPGLLRYLFRLYTFCFPKKNYVESKKRYGAIIAASFFIVLLIGLVTQGSLQYFILLLGSLAILVSFSIGIIEYHSQ